MAHPASDGIGDVGVVIVPPIGYEYWSSHRTLRTLAERLARNGCLALRFDFDGRGDSAGDQWDPARLEAWQSNIGQAADALRGWGVTRLVVIGLRIGGTLALTQGAAVGADAVVAWAPVARGSRYVRELQLLGLAVPETPDLPGRAGVVQAGSVFSAETLAGLGAIDLGALPDRPAMRVLVVDRDDKPASTAILDRLRALGVEPDHVVREGADLFLDQPTEYATVPGDIVDEITGVGRPQRGLSQRRQDAAGAPDDRDDRLAGRRRRRGGRGTRQAGPRRHPHPAAVRALPGHRGVAEFGLGAPCRSRPGLGGVRPDAGAVRLHLLSGGLLRLG